MRGCVRAAKRSYMLLWFALWWADWLALEDFSYSLLTEFSEVRSQACNTVRLPRPGAEEEPKSVAPAGRGCSGGRWDRQTQRTGGKNHS
jgi:hypothetical protein